MGRAAVEIEVLRRGAPSDEASEGETVEVVVACQASRLPPARLFVNEACLLDLGEPRGGDRVRIPFPVGDCLGPSLLSVRDAAGVRLGPTLTMFVRPGVLTAAAVKEIEERLLPELGAELGGAELLTEAVTTGRKRLVPLAPKPEERDKDHPDEVNFETLRRFSDRLISVTEPILNLLSYRSTLYRKTVKQKLFGRINWQRTLPSQTRRGAEGGLWHVCERRRRTFATTLNELLVRFHVELGTHGLKLVDLIALREEERARWHRRLGLDASYGAETGGAVRSLRILLGRHHDAVTHPALAELRDSPVVRGAREPPPPEKLRQEAERQRNKAYPSLVALWEEYVATFHRRRIEEPSFEGASMAQVFRIWALLELARSLRLRRACGGASRLRFESADRATRLRLAGSDAPAPPGLARLVGLGAEEERGGGPDALLRMGTLRVAVLVAYPAPGADGGTPPEVRLLGHLEEYGLAAGLAIVPRGRARLEACDRPGGRPALVAVLPLGPDRAGERLRAALGEVSAAAALLDAYAARPAERRGRKVFAALARRITRRAMTFGVVEAAT